jgi:hypothetical protein
MRSILRQRTMLTTLPLVIMLFIMTLVGSANASPVLVGWDYGPSGGLVRFDIHTGTFIRISSSPD